MSKKAEHVKGSIPSKTRIRVEINEAIESLEYAVQILKDSGGFAREMASRARADADLEAAAEYDAEAEEAESHVKNLCRLAGSLRVMAALDNPHPN